LTKREYTSLFTHIVYTPTLDGCHRLLTN